MEEEDDMLSINEKLNIEKTKNVIYPDSSFKSFWDILSFLFVVY